jgi:predicted DNA-binding transcriptional regulator AlpA
MTDRSSSDCVVRITGVWPRGLSSHQGAAYFGISRTMFLELVDSGELPKPLRLRGRTIWDRHELDETFSRLTNRPGASGLGAERWVASK